MQKYALRHYEKVRALSPECMVLLKSNGDFPLEGPCRVALYGNGARHTVKGGTGSGDVYVSHFSTIEESLQKSGFTITTGDWLNAYDRIRREAEKAFRGEIKQKIIKQGMSALLESIGAIMTEPEYELPLDAKGDAAIYILSRICGEGADRKAIAGDFAMTETEKRDILQLQRMYSRFMLVLNVGDVIDISPVLDVVSNILLLGETGAATGDAFVDVLVGKAYPSGKLASTWATWDAYCHEGDFGENDDTRYREGIYVGYRYFDSIGKAPMFPFGFGLSYTRFEIRYEYAEVEGNLVSAHVRVRNSGERPGKEVVQLYVSVPSGQLDQPCQMLAAFCKTKELMPGEEQQVVLTFSMSSLASFNSENACSMLEKGKYLIRIGNSSRDTIPCAVAELSEDVVVQKLSHIGGIPDFVDWKPDDSDAMDICVDLPRLSLNASALIEKTPTASASDVRMPEFIKNLSDDDLAYFCIGAYNENGSKSVIGDSAKRVPAAAGETTNRFEALGVPVLVMADGPAGVRIAKKYGIDEKGIYTIDTGELDDKKEMVPEEILALLGYDKTPQIRGGEIYEQNCTAIPVGTSLAQSWSEAVCIECGDIVGDEMERFGVHLWLAPALNIHRMVLCGRNFEYYSEDPLISGKMAAAITKGVQKHPGCGVTIKHFCCNNQETNRTRSNSAVSERALRDIYLRGFKIAVTEASPAAVMTSYNLLNGEHTSQRKDLCETVLREEWGFSGVVMSDWLAADYVNPADKYPNARAGASVCAGNDIIMPGEPRDHEDLMKALENGEVTRQDLERSAGRVISLAKELGSAHKEIERYRCNSILYL